MEGQNARLQCTQDNGHNAMYWYQQTAGQELQFLFSFYSSQQQSKGDIPARFTADQPQSDHSNLMIESVKPEDSAIYFCASSLDTVLQRNPFFLQ